MGGQAKRPTSIPGLLLANMGTEKVVACTLENHPPQKEKQNKSRFEVSIPRSEDAVFLSSVASGSTGQMGQGAIAEILGCRPPLKHLLRKEMPPETGSFAPPGSVSSYFCC